MDDDAVDARVDLDQLEPEWRLRRLEPARPVGGHGRLAAQHAARIEAPLDDERRRHFEVVAVVREDAIEVVSVPRRDPVGGEVRGEIRIAGFNLLNLFNGDGAGGGFPTPRGANEPAELARQTDKLVGAVAAIAPDAAALMEVENDGYGEESTIAGFVRALNARLGEERGDYAFVARDAAGVGSDQIGVAMIYRTSTLKPLGAPAVLETGAFASGNRVPLVQAFAPVAGGDPFVLVANHLKSKRCGESDAANGDHHDGQGCWNALRAQAARELADWLATDPTAQGAAAQTLVVEIGRAHV